MGERSGNNEDERSEMALEPPLAHFVPGYLIETANRAKPKSIR